jgi:hypothetical protein
MALVLFGPNAVSAQMSSCINIDRSLPAKLVISRLIASGIPDTRTASDAAYQSASSVASNLNSFLSREVVRVVTCRERWPEIDGTDFQSDVVKDLNSRHVLFEVWGNLVVSQSGPSAGTMAEGLVSYFMIPIPQSVVSWPDLQLHQHDYRGRKTRLRDLFTSVFTQGRQFEVLASIAIAIRARHNENYDGAHSAFCHARFTLEQARRNGTWNFGVDARGLASDIDKLVKENLLAALSNNSYGGALGSVDIAVHTRCPGT